MEELAAAVDALSRDAASQVWAGLDAKREEPGLGCPPAFSWISSRSCLPGSTLSCTLLHMLKCWLLQQCMEGPCPASP